MNKGLINPDLDYFIGHEKGCGRGENTARWLEGTCVHNSIFWNTLPFSQEVRGCSLGQENKRADSLRTSKIGIQVPYLGIQGPLSWNSGSTLGVQVPSLGIQVLSLGIQGFFSWDSGPLSRNSGYFLSGTTTPSPGFADLSCAQVVQPNLSLILNTFSFCL